MVELVPIPQPTFSNGVLVGDLNLPTPAPGPASTPGASALESNALPLLFFPEDKAPSTVHVSIIDFDGTDATMLVNCPSKTCSGDFPERTVVQGDDSWSEYVVADGTTTYRMCTDSGDTEVACGVQSGKNLKTATAFKDLKPTSTYNECWGANNFVVAQVTAGLEKVMDDGEINPNMPVIDADTVQKILDYKREEACSGVSSANTPQKTSSTSKNGSKDEEDKDDESKDNKDSGALRMSMSGGLMAFLAVSTLFASFA